ncbi:transglycosylase [Coniothyrium glycines]
MYNVLASIVFLLAGHTLGQITTSCNPLERTCPDNPALSSKSYAHDFATGLDDSNWNITAGNVTSTSSGAHFIITKAGDAPTIRSKWYIFFGRVSFTLRSAPGTGIVSSAILLSDDLDEFDWEFLGSESTTVQMNYFGEGKTTTTDRELDATVSSNTQTNSHNYTLVWTETQTQWIIDGIIMRTLTPSQATSSGNSYPQSPMDVRIGIWAGGDSGNAEGTIEWAGGLTDYTQGPFEMVLEHVEVENYNPGYSYTYTDMSGDADSIRVNLEGSSSSSRTSTASGTASTVVSLQTKAATHSATTTATGALVTGGANATAGVAPSLSGGAQVGMRGHCVLVVLGAMAALL